jgi:SAM-dependent methyltransferase
VYTPSVTIEPRYDADARTLEQRRALHEQNRLSWNEATKAHNSHKADQAAFFRAGGNKLHGPEIDLLGDLRGKSVLHLQCNAGQDPLSIKQLGAESVTGVDISDEAIDFARQLSADSGIPAEFHRADVYDWLAEAAAGDRRWDIVFCSYGAIIWLSDLDSWAHGIATVLKPGGRFVAVEFHPIEMMFDEELRHVWPYSTSGGPPMTWDDGIGDYVAESGPSLTPSGWQDGVEAFTNPHPAHEFHWGTAEIITALLDAGLVLEHFREYDYSTFKMYHKMHELPGGLWALPEGTPRFPLMYSIAARKP